MITETYTPPSQQEIDRIRFRARQMQAEAVRAGFRAVAHWIAHPSLHPHHA